jgi:hypothetical protein
VLKVFRSGCSISAQIGRVTGQGIIASVKDFASSWLVVRYAPALKYGLSRRGRSGHEGADSLRVSPNSKAHLMVARRTTIDADMRVASFRQWVDACDVHFFPTPTLGQFSATGHQQAFKYRHGSPH